MSNKKTRKEQAIKKSKQKNRIIIAVFALLLVAVIATVVIVIAQRGQERVFSEGNQSVTLRDNGNFTASLAHNVNRSGTFTETEDGDVITISFTEGGATVTGSIIDGVLHLPEQWNTGCGHGHNTELPLTRGGQ